LVLPGCNTATMNLHLAEIALAVAPGAHAVLLMDQAGWHTTGKLKVPENISIVALPSKSPELNPQENIWQFMRDDWLSPGCSPPTKISSTTAAMPRTSSSISPGRSCPSASVIGIGGLIALPTIVVEFAGFSRPVFAAEGDEGPCCCALFGRTCHGKIVAGLLRRVELEVVESHELLRETGRDVVGVSWNS
jgi:hypothetical protein